MITNRLLYKDTVRNASNPGIILAGTRTMENVIYTCSNPSINMYTEAARFKPHDKTRIIGIPHLGQALNGTFTATVDFKLTTAQIPLVWYVGGVYYSGGVTRTAVDNRAYVVDDSMTSSSTGTKCGAFRCGARFKDGKLEIRIITYNAGLPDTIMAYFAVGLYYDRFDPILGDYEL